MYSPSQILYYFIVYLFYYLNYIIYYLYYYIILYYIIYYIMLYYIILYLSIIYNIKIDRQIDRQLDFLGKIVLHIIFMYFYFHKIKLQVKLPQNLIFYFGETSVSFLDDTTETSLYTSFEIVFSTIKTISTRRRYFYPEVMVPRK